MYEGQAILLVRLAHLGDVIFTLPAAQAVRAAFPEARITFLIARRFAPLLAGCPGLDAVLTLDQDLYRARRLGRILTETFRLLRRLRRSRFALAIDFQGFGETALLTWWSGAPQRWGSVYRPSRKWAYTHPIPRATHLHPIDYHLDLLRRCGLPSVPVRNQFVLPEDVLTEARRAFSEHGLRPDCPTLFIQPFTSSPHKNWPLEAWLVVARHWRSHGLQVLFGGGPAERTALEPARQAGYPVAAGAPLLVSAGLAGLCSLVAGGDTGLLHLAVAMGKRVVMLMPSLGPGSCHPYGHPDWVLTPPGGQPFAALAPEAVNQACGQAFAAAER